MSNSLAVAGPNSKWQQPGVAPAGFWAGLWHGIIAPITLIVGLFYVNVRIYEKNNSGKLYVFGFLIGVGAFSAKASRLGH